MSKKSLLKPIDNVLDARLNGTRIGAFFSELLANSGHFLIVNALSEISLIGWISYLKNPGHYLIAGASIAQAWYLSRPRANRFWGNLIGAAIYTLSDWPLEGMDFFREPNHIILWVFSLIIATLQGIRFHYVKSFDWLVTLESCTRTGIFVALYILLEFKLESAPISWHNMANFLQTSQHQFLFESMIFVGILIGLQTLQVRRQKKQLQETALVLRNMAEWGMGSYAVTKAVTDPAELEFKRRERTIVFMDVRGFTRWCEQTTPDAVAALLNSYYRTVEPAAGAYKPLRITLTADEIMAIYSQPEMGVAAAVAMQKAATIELSPYELGAGCAVHCGSAIEGLFGSQDVRTYTVIGDTVNTAKRLESATPGGEITISDRVYQAVSGLEVKPCEPIVAKGKAEAIAVWRLVIS